jgi:hypothetical protein
MANRVPLIVDTTTLFIKELPISDNLDLTDSGIVGITSIGRVDTSEIGISTFGLNVSGIVTALGGFNIGIQSGGTNITTGVVTALNFVGAGNTFSYIATTRTIDINIGGSQWSFVDPANPTTSNIYRETGSVGIGSITFTGTEGQVLQVSGISSGVYIGGSVGIGITKPDYKLHLVGTGTTSLYVEGQTQLTRVAITTTSDNLTMVTGRSYAYYSSVTLTLPSSPTVGDTLRIINRSGTTTAIIGRNGSNIMGVADDVQFDELNGTYNFTYSNNVDGWVISR